MIGIRGISGDAQKLTLTPQSLKNLRKITLIYEVRMKIVSKMPLIL